MTTLEMEIFMMRVFNPYKMLVVPNVSFGMLLGNKYLHECDLLALTRDNYATEIEIKISRTDIKKDSLKKHGHLHNHIARLYFAVPEKLVECACEFIPERAGLYSVSLDGCATLVRQCKRNGKAVKWTDRERYKLAHLGAMRILGLKKKIAKIK